MGIPMGPRLPSVNHVLQNSTEPMEQQQLPPLVNLQANPQMTTLNSIKNVAVSSPIEQMLWFKPISNNAVKEPLKCNHDKISLHKRKQKINHTHTFTSLLSCHLYCNINYLQFFK